MNPIDLHAAIESTKAQIYQVKQQIKETAALQEKPRLKHRLKELQYLQLWYLEQIG